MNERRTSSILQRLPVILRVTAASYGLRPQNRTEPAKSVGAPAMQELLFKNRT